MHEREWERLVQSRIRTATSAPPPPQFMLVGSDAEGIGAAVWYEELDGAGNIEVRVGAVALRHRRRGGGVADEMVAALFDALTEKALHDGVDIVLVQTWVDERNRPSQAMCRRAGMHQLSEDPDGTLQRWGANILIGGADFPGAFPRP